MRRLLAYSAIAHAGYILLGVMAPGSFGISGIVYYTITYALATLGAFGVVALVEQAAGQDSFEAFAGLGRRSPLVGGCMMIFILSLAGIPPLAGFFAKFYVFAAGLRVGQGDLSLLWLVVLAIAGSALSLYYYLRILKEVQVSPPGAAAPELAVPAATGFVLIVLALGTIFLGCFPGVPD